MAKVKLNSLVTSISGALCHHDGTYFATNKQTGKCYAVQVCNPSEKPATEKQIANRAKFKAQMQAVSAWLAQNKPTESNTQGTEAYQKARAAYEAQHKIGSFTAYVSKHVIGATSAPQGGTTPDPDAPLEL